MSKERFEWDPAKDRVNQEKHGVSFGEACHAFADPMRVIVSVRFTYRGDRIRIYGAGFWRAGRRKYEAENQIH